jgi:aspartate 1-decarboxylase
MQRTFLRAKIHNCTLTDTRLDYEGSISVDLSLLEAVDILPYEQVQVVNITNGKRLITYAIAAPYGSGQVELNGAAARCGEKGDCLIIMTYAQVSPSDLSNLTCKVAIIGEQNVPHEILNHPVTNKELTLTNKESTL